MLPVHVGIIMDGNRRWAAARGKHPWEGHRAGAEAVRKVLEKGDELGIKHVTLYLWSLKNDANRSADERKHIFDLMLEFIKRFSKEAKKRSTQVRFLGRWENAEIKGELKKIMSETEQFKDKSLNFCFMYDGQEEIVDACNATLASGAKTVDANTFKQHLYSSELPPLDLIIRTGMSDGQRLSGFMLWDASYAELIFHDTLLPDYTPQMLEDDVQEFERRNRRFGK